jgi:hypothetical protein
LKSDGSCSRAAAILADTMVEGVSFQQATARLGNEKKGPLKAIDITELVAEALASKEVIGKLT